MLHAGRSVLGALCLLSAAAFADETPGSASSRDAIFSVVFENDLFANVDQHYTNGVRFSYLSRIDQVPEFVRRNAEAFPLVPKDTKMHVEYALGQSMYTPHRITSEAPDARDRPYAGWLYFSVGVVAVRDELLDQLSLALGVVGPSALAGETQRLVHRIVGADRPQGWAHQLHGEAGAVLGYQRTWRHALATSALGYAVDVAPHLGFALGNVFTYADGGATLRIGRNLPDDFGVPRIDPSLPGSGYFEQKGSGGYLFAGVSGRAVARNIFLDGNTFRDSPSVDRVPLVADAQVGLTWSWSRLRLAYTHVFRSREFHGQQYADQFGALTLSYRF